jgi:hypothetical protein
VHFEAAADLAGRTGLGFWMVREGYLKQEIVIDPVTYALMGYKDVAIKDHAMAGTDGTRYVKKGHVMGWAALLGSAIVAQPGRLPYPLASRPPPSHRLAPASLAAGWRRSA